jgi:hypothetical protein
VLDVAPPPPPTIKKSTANVGVLVAGLPQDETLKSDAVLAGNLEVIVIP